MLLTVTLSGCIGNDGTEVVDLSDDLAQRDAELLELQADLVNMTELKQASELALALVQSQQESLQIQISTAESNISEQEATITSLESQLTLAESHAEDLMAEMSTMSDESNETYLNMSGELESMNSMISNISATLNETSLWLSENASAVNELTLEIAELTSELAEANLALATANATIAAYVDAILDEQELAALKSHEWGLFSARALDPNANGNPSIIMTGTTAQTQVTYTSSIQEEHTILFEYCNRTITDEDHFSNVIGWIFDEALDSTYSTESNIADRVLIDWEFGDQYQIRCAFATMDISANQYNDTWVFPNLGMMAGMIEISDFHVSICLVDECDRFGTYDYDYDQYNSGPMHSWVFGNHPLNGIDFIPVNVSGDPCSLDWSTANQGVDVNACPVPLDCTEHSDWQSGPFTSDCTSVFIFDRNAYGADNATLVNASTAVIYQDGAYSEQDVFICVVDSNVLVVNEVYNELNVYVRGLGSSNALTITTSHSSGTVTGMLGAEISYSNGLYSEINIYNWEDPSGVC
jgi:predicted  nucleic acid-binding Zn-ribbon protein